MKKNLLLFLIGILTTSCYSVYKVVPQTYDFTETINFTVDKIEEGNSIATIGGNWIASRGNKFVFVHLTLKNNLDEKQKLDFHNFSLLNSRTQTKHQAKWAMVVGPINMWGKINSYIRKGEEQKRKLVFIYPEIDKPKILEVNETFIEIEYE